MRGDEVGIMRNEHTMFDCPPQSNTSPNATSSSFALLVPSLTTSVTDLLDGCVTVTRQLPVLSATESTGTLWEEPVGSVESVTLTVTVAPGTAPSPHTYERTQTGPGSSTGAPEPLCLAEGSFRQQREAHGNSECDELAQLHILTSSS